MILDTYTIKAKLVLTGVLFLAYFSVHGQQESILFHEGKIEWSPQSDTGNGEQGVFYFPFTFSDAEYTGCPLRYPVYHLRIPLPGPSNINCSLRSVSTQELIEPGTEWRKALPGTFDIQSRVSRDRNHYFADIRLIPLSTSGQSIWALESFLLAIQTTPIEKATDRNGEYALFSVLDEGSIFRLPVSQSGMYKMDYDFLSGLGVDMGQIDPAQIQLFGNGGGPLPESLSSARIDDLAENPLLVIGGEDGSFDPGDLILFYAEGPDVWTFDPLEGRYNYVRNIYDTHNYYFLRTNVENGLRITSVPDVSHTGYQSSTSDFPQVYENDKTNLLAQYDHTEGTGQSWYGESFFSTKEQDFLSKFDVASLLLGEPLQYELVFAARNGSASTVSLTIGDETFSRSINGVSIQSPEATYAREGRIEGSLLLASTPGQLKVKTNAYQGWLDKIQLNGRRLTSYQNKPLILSDRFSLEQEKAGFEIAQAPDGLIIWNITDAVRPFEQGLSNSEGGKKRFGYSPEDQLLRFIAFRPQDVSLIPGKASRVENQNLHGIFDADMIIVYHPDFRQQAERLAAHRRDFNGFDVNTVAIQQIYNEFSSGRQDPTAIRDFVKMIYDRNEEFAYLLLFGDGSYDYKSILNSANNDNFIPVYETKESLNPISGYVSDDYFALLSDDEGYDLEGDMDIAIGRLPVRTAAQAKILVDKIIAYETSPESDGDWQNRIALIADDEDASRHLDQTETVAKYLQQNHPVFNLEKIYLDAFKQEVNPGGHRYPEANKSINDNVFKGILAMTYIGHGGPGGFAQERVLRLEDIYSWNNDPKLPLLITATCSFAGFDDPAINTAGEASILKENGGVISLFSTVRLVYSNENSILINAVFNEIFTKYDGHYLKLGEVLRYAKNKIGNKDNKRKFFLFGDPAMQLALPEYQVFTTSINGKDVQQGVFQDTLRALSKVRIEGYVGNIEGQVMTDFNGVIYPTVFDKVKLTQTLGNDSGSPIRSFDTQKQVLFKGEASVKNGQFDFEFILPKDIDYRNGFGKLSYFYSNGDNREANGYFNEFMIGGTSEEAILDEEGPVISLYLNHTGFTSGDVTNNRPILLALLNDASGINISGTSIGHDLRAVLDDDLAGSFNLNAFFQSSRDDYTSGVIQFPLNKLDPGRHKLYLEAWDILNNKGEATVDFIVADEEAQVLTHLFNYPNPVDAFTRFYFEHTLPDTELDVRITIFDLSGRLVKTIEALAVSDGYRINHIEGDGNGDGGNALPNGTYVYHVRVNSAVLGLAVESAFEKLVLIK